MKLKSIKGIKWFRDIINNPKRQYGIEVLHHLPEKVVSFESLKYENFILHPKEHSLAKSLVQLFDEVPLERVYPDTYAATIEGGVIIGNSGIVVTPDGFIIAETAAHTGYEDGRCLTINELIKNYKYLQNSGHIEGNTLAAANPHSGYSHHLMESFFSILWFDQKPIDHIHVAKGNNHDRVSEFLQALGIPTSYLVVTTPKQYLTCERVSFFGPNAFPLVRSETVDLVENLLVAPRRLKGPALKKYYLVTEQKTVLAQHRIPKNENQVKEFLQKDGYELIDPATLDLNEKIGLFSLARECISQGGSGMVNPIYFCPKNAKVGQIVDNSSLIKSFTNIFGHTKIKGYNTIPILPVYRDFCIHKGKLLNHWNLAIKTHIERFPILQRISYSVNTSMQGITIDMRRFVEWYEILKTI